MLNLESIKVDLTAELNGQYIEIPDWEGVSLGVRSLEIPAYKIAMDLVRERFKRVYKGKPVPPDVIEAEFGKLLAKHILFGWKGISPEYSEDYAAEFLSDSSGRELAKKIVWAASSVAEVDAEFTADAVKN